MAIPKASECSARIAMGSESSPMRIDWYCWSVWEALTVAPSANPLMLADESKYTWIVSDPEMLGGKLAIRGTRLSVSLILECLASGMTLDDIDKSFANGFPHEALPEVLLVASELADSFRPAA